MPSSAISAVAVIAGLPVACTELSASLSKQANSDTGRCTFPINSVDNFGQEIELAYFMNLSPDDPFVTLFNGVPVFDGTVDDVEVDYDAGLIHVSGRDRSKGPIEKKTTESFKNKTRQQIAQEIAGRHGLGFVGTGGADKAGKRQQIDWAHITDEISEWSLVQRLADEDGKVAFITKNVLNYVDLDSTTVGALTLYYVPQSGAGSAQSNFLSLKIHRNLQAGRPHKVNVHSHHTKKFQTYHENAAKGGVGQLREFDYEHAGLEPGQGKKIAQKRLRQATRHEMTCNFAIPGVGHEYVAANMILIVVGAGAFGQSFFIDEVRHEMSSSGYVISGTAKNSKGGG